MLTERGGPIRVFLLDDHEIVRRGIKDLLESEGDIEVVGGRDSRRRQHVAFLR
jgi:two-component system response regulator DevR